MARRGPVAGAQRARIVDAMAYGVGERGFSCTTISDVCADARVSRSTFYETFDGLQDCFLAVLDGGHDRAQALIGAAFAGAECWREGIRVALGGLLALFDDEPLLARVWFVEALAAGSWALERRERHVRALTTTIVERWPLPEGACVNPLAATAVMESVLGIVHTRLLTGGGESFVELLGPLMGLIAAIYAGAPAAVVELERGEAHAREIQARRASQPAVGGVAGDSGEGAGDEGAGGEGDTGQGAGDEGVGGVDVPAALRDPRAHRGRECLRYVARNPRVSNRELADAIGITRPAQISRLLVRLAALGLLDKHKTAPGGPNAWSLTPLGAQVLQALESGTRAPIAVNAVSAP